MRCKLPVLLFFAMLSTAAAATAPGAEALLQQAQQQAGKEPQAALQLLEREDVAWSAPQQLRRARLACEIYLDLGKATQALASSDVLQAGDPSADRVSTLLCRGAAYLRLGQVVQASAGLQAAEDAARQLQDNALLAAVLLKRADLHILQNQQDSAFKLLEEAYVIAGRHGLAELRQHALNSLASVYYSSGRLDLAEEYYRELLAIAEASGSEDDLAIALFNLGHALASQEKFAEADAAFARSLKLSEQLNDRLGSAFTLKASAESALAQGQPQLARQRFGEALDIFGRANEAQQYASTLRHLGDVALSLGEYQKAVDRYLEAAPILKQHRFLVALMRTYRGLSEAYGMLGQFEQAYRFHQAYTVLLQDNLEQQNEQSTKRMQSEFETQRLVDKNEHLQLKNLRQQEQISHDRRMKIALVALISLAALALVLAVVLWVRSRQYGARMEQLATRDELTGIRNRRAVLQHGEQEWQRATRYQRPLACLLFDVDHFKSVNDTYGHPVGDQVLQRVAADVRDTVRASDILGRFGGEEFLVIATDTSLQQALALAERVRAAVAAHAYTAMDGRSITVSIGVAANESADGLQGLIQHADEALYRAKQGGRDRVEAFAGDGDALTSADDGSTPGIATAPRAVQPAPGQ